jgi:uncharacterized glyoxalase superfamily protein PhnB
MNLTTLCSGVLKQFDGATRLNSQRNCSTNRGNGTERPESTATIRLPGLILSMGNDAAKLARQCDQFMKLRTGESWMPAPDYGRSLKALTVNLLARNMDKALQFQREVLRADIVYSDLDFAVVRGYGAEWMLHADHTYQGHPLELVLANAVQRGAGAELRLHGCNPDEAEASARRLGFKVLVAATNKPHGLREAYLVDADGYVWVPDVHAKT